MKQSKIVVLVLVWFCSWCLSCAESETSKCEGDRICPSGTVCSDTGGCVVPEQAALCKDKEDGTSCNYADIPDGVCAVGLCVPVGCGNAVLEVGEVCDDGNNSPRDGCSADCSSEEVCGNGVIDELVGEACDDGNTVSEDGCQSNCASPTCGDGFEDPQFNEACDEGDDNSEMPNAICRSNCQKSRCGDGIIDDATEECDDGNPLFGDGCGDCRNEVCGNGILDVVITEGGLAPAEGCDDGNFLNHDGCPSDCSTLESQVWSQVRCSQTPARAGAAFFNLHISMAYDALRGQTVMSNFGKTWEWNGESWLELTPLVRPSPRSFIGHAMAYDRERQKTILFGGITEFIRDKLGETWEWDGATWTERTISGASPSPRRGHAMAYDARRQRIVLYGGGEDDASGTGFERLGDTWEWDGATWTQLTPPNSPGPRQLHSMAYDPKRGRVVLFGGSGNQTQTPTGTWEWDGLDWTEIISVNEPVRERFSMAYDGIRERIVLYGGTGGTAQGDDMWEWDGNSWIEIAMPTSADNQVHHAMVFDGQRGRIVLVGIDGTTREWNGITWTDVSPTVSAPSSRNLHAMAYDPGRGRIVMFGGRAQGSSLGDTWEWDGRCWSEVFPTTAPVASDKVGMIFDESQNRIVLVTGVPDTQVWEWDGTTWIEQTTTSTLPPSRGEVTIAYDARRERIVMFSGTFLVRDTWEWDGSAWNDVSPVAENSPPARVRHAMNYDPLQEEIVMFGGFDGTDGFLGTWQWNGTTWVDHTPPPTLTPNARLESAMTFDLALGQTVMFSGEHFPSGPNQNDTWIWDETWREQTQLAEASPQRMFQHAMAFDSRTNRSVVLGDRLTDTNDADTWSFQSRARVGEICTTGFDTDGDGLAGCNDPDCWGYCEPFCPPNLPCDGAAPRCGDGSCNPNLESPRLCPADCGVPTALCGDFICDASESFSSCPGDCTP